MIRRLFTYHDRRRVQIAIRHLRENAAIRHAQAIHPDYPAFRINHRQRIIRPPHPRCPAWVIRAFRMFPDKRINLRVRLHTLPRLNLVFHMRLHRRLPENLARQADTGAELFPIARLAHVIEPDHRIRRRIG